MNRFHNLNTVQANYVTHLQMIPIHPEAAWLSETEEKLVSSASLSHSQNCFPFQGKKTFKKK